MDRGRIVAYKRSWRKVLKSRRDQTVRFTAQPLSLYSHMRQETDRERRFDGVDSIAYLRSKTVQPMGGSSYENSLNPYENRREGVELLSRLCPHTIAPSPQITKLARKIMKSSKVKPRDALHLACAETAACDYFVTCDDALIETLKRKRSALKLELKAVNPVEFIRREGEQYGES